MVISVAPADFSHKNDAETDEATGSNNGSGNFFGREGNYAGGDEDEGEGEGEEGAAGGGGYGPDDGQGEEEEESVPPFAPLPSECRSSELPTCVLRDVYTAEQALSDPNFILQLEADMLMECCKFGKVTLLRTEHPV